MLQWRAGVRVSVAGWEAVVGGRVAVRDERVREGEGAGEGVGVVRVCDCHQSSSTRRRAPKRVRRSA